MVKNGAIPTRQLAKVDATHYAAPGCVAAFRAWSVRMVALGYPALTAGTAADSCYRSLAWQQHRYAIFRRDGRPVAAYPGTSNHGLGMAIDIGNYYRYPKALLRAEGRRYGFIFDTPSEDWHVKFTGAPKYKSLTPATVTLLPLEDKMYLLYNSKTNQAFYRPGKPLKRITEAEAGKYARLLKQLGEAPKSGTLDSIRTKLDNEAWNTLVTLEGIV